MQNERYMNIIQDKKESVCAVYVQECSADSGRREKY